MLFICKHMQAKFTYHRYHAQEVITGWDHSKIRRRLFIIKLGTPRVSTKPFPSCCPTFANLCSASLPVFLIAHLWVSSQGDRGEKEETRKKRERRTDGRRSRGGQEGEEEDRERKAQENSLPHTLFLFSVLPSPSLLSPQNSPQSVLVLDGFPVFNSVVPQRLCATVFTAPTTAGRAEPGKSWSLPRSCGTAWRRRGGCCREAEGPHLL